MIRNNIYIWDSLIPESSPINISDLHQAEEGIKLLSEHFQMDRATAENEIKAVYNDYLIYKEVISKSENQQVRQEMSDIHKFISKVESGEIKDFSIVLKGTTEKKVADKKKVVNEKCEIKSSYLLQFIPSQMKLLPDPKYIIGRRKGPSDVIIMQANIVIKFNDKYKNIVPFVKDRLALIGMLMHGAKIISITKLNRHNIKTVFYDKVKVIQQYNLA